MASQAQLNQAIREAHLALEDLDNFDLESGDPKSMAEFDTLERLHDEALARVVSQARQYGQNGLTEAKVCSTEWRWVPKAISGALDRFRKAVGGAHG